MSEQVTSSYTRTERVMTAAAGVVALAGIGLGISELAKAETAGDRIETIGAIAVFEMSAAALYLAPVTNRTIRAEQQE